MTNYDPLDPIGQERTQRDREMRDRLAHEREAGDLKWLMGSKRGRRIVWRILDQSGVFRLSFHPNAMQMAFAEGNRNFGNRVLALIHAECPELYPAMMKEQNYDRSAEDAGNSESN